MKTFDSIEELKPYYNEKTNTYEFVENGMKMDVEFTFDLNVASHILARNINAPDIKARNIDAGNINVWDINTINIDAMDINAMDINALDINALNINARDINVGGINAWNIDAWNVSYYAVCFAYKNIVCKSINGRRDNCKHFVLDGEIIFKEEKKSVTLELTDEQLEKIKELLG